MSIMLFLVSIVGCGGQKEQYSLAELIDKTVVTAAPGQLPLTDTKAELTVMISRPSYVADLDANFVTEWYEEYTNVRVKYIQLLEGNAGELANLQIAAGDYPDIIMGAMTAANETRYADQGIFIPIDELIAQQGYWYHKMEERIPGITKAITQSDGRIYGLPTINQAFHFFFPMKAWINSEWLDKLGISMPQTTDEFYQMLKAFATMDPNGNGIADEIPMMGYSGGGFSAPYGFLLNSFVYFDPNNFLAMDNGKVKFVADTEDFRDGLRYIAKLVDEGLLNRISFTQNGEQAKAIGTNPAAPLVGVFTEATWWSVVGHRTDLPDFRADKYVGLSPLQGPKGVRYSLWFTDGFSPAVAQITDKAKDPVLAFRWLDALYSEEATMNFHIGMKGVMRDDPDPGSLGINREPALWKQLAYTSESATGNPYWAPNNFLGNRYSELRLGEQADWDNPNTQFEQEPKLYMETLTKFYPFAPTDAEMFPLNMNYTIEETNELGRLWTQIRTYVNENIVAFVTGNKNLDRDWDAYVGEFGRLGLSRLLEIRQTAYDRQYAR